MPARIGARTFAVLKHKGTVVLAFAHQAQAQLMILFRLAAVSYKDVCADGAVRDNPTDSSYAVQIPLTGIFAVHQLQDPVASALNGQMNVMTDIRLPGNHMQRLVAHILRMRSGKPYPHLGHLTCHASQQFRESNYEL